MDKTVPIVTLYELPVGTVINDRDNGRYELTEISERRIWMEQYGHCVDCTEMVAEDKFPEQDFQYGTIIHEKAEMRFRNWSVDLVPPLISEDLLDRINKFNDAQIAKPL